VSYKSSLTQAQCTLHAVYLCITFATEEAKACSKRFLNAAAAGAEAALIAADTSLLLQLLAHVRIASVTTVEAIAFWQADAQARIAALATAASSSTSSTADTKQRPTSATSDGLTWAATITLPGRYAHIYIYIYLYISIYIYTI
jgi:hypothetical protein